MTPTIQDAMNRLAELERENALLYAAIEALSDACGGGLNSVNQFVFQFESVEGAETAWEKYHDALGVVVCREQTEDWK